MWAAMRLTLSIRNCSLFRTTGDTSIMPLRHG